MTATIEEAPAEETTSEKPVSDWLQRKIEEREAARAAGKPAPPRRGRKSTPPPATPPRKRTAPRQARAKKATDYTEGIIGGAQILALPLAFVAPADSVALTHHAPPIAKALNDLAQDKPEVAAALDKVLAGGPYAALFAAAVPLFVQVGHNHGLIPEHMAVQLGATPKRTILAGLRAQAEAAKAAAEGLADAA